MLEAFKIACIVFELRHSSIFTSTQCIYMIYTVLLPNFTYVCYASKIVLSNPISGGEAMRDNPVKKKKCRNDVPWQKFRTFPDHSPL